MNIDSIRNYPTRMPLKYQSANEPESKQKNESVGLRKNEQKLNRGYYSGSFTGLNGAAVGASNSLLNKVLVLCNDHTVIAQNLVALALATTLRPAAIMALPGDKEDKAYASGHAIASGLIGFGFSSLVMSPLGKAAKKARAAISQATDAINILKGNMAELTKEQLDKIEKLKKDFNVSDIKELENHKFFKKLKDTYGVNNIAEIGNSKAFKNVTKILDMAPDVFVFGILKAMLTVALIPPILKYGFGLEKKKKAPVQNQPQNISQQNIQNLMPPKMEKPDMTKFAGGLK